MCLPFEPKIAEDRLPLVKANISLEGVDDAKSECLLPPAEMIWDTGAHQTIVAEEILPTEFREFLKDPIHNKYRSEHGVHVQIKAAIVFTNSPVFLSAIALVVPKSKIPNNLPGILFGQSSCINYLSYQSIPRSILEAGGETISPEFWGDNVIDKFLDEAGNLVYI